MTSTNSQFHATIEELILIAQKIAMESSVEVMIIRYFPFRTRLIDRNSIASILRDESIERLVFTHGPAKPTGAGNLELLDANEGALVLDIGREGPTGMTESRLSTSAAHAAWKDAINVLSQHTIPGAIGTSKLNGATATYRNHRLSPGAVERMREGVCLRQFATSPVFFKPLRSDLFVAGPSGLPEFLSE